jgi:hypothetical protein
MTLAVSTPGDATAMLDPSTLVPSGRPVITNLSPDGLNDGRIPVNASS